MSDHTTNDLFKVGSTVVQLYTRVFRTSEKKSSVDDINKKPDKKRINLTRTLFNYSSHFETKIRVGCGMWEHIMNDLFQLAMLVVEFYLIIWCTSKQLFGDKNIIRDRVRDEKFKQRFCWNISVFAEKRSRLVT